MTTPQKPFTKAQQTSLDKIWNAIAVIERIVPQEQKRFSSQRKRWLENALESLRIHAGRFAIRLPNLGLMYLPEKYTQHARFVSEQLAERGINRPERTLELDELLALKAETPRPLTYCLCGSTDKAVQAFRAESLRLTLAGYKVLSIGANTKDSDLGITEAQKVQLDILHLYKIEDADVVRILNVGGYIGESTRRELEYARRLGKQIEFLEESGADLVGTGGRV